MERDVACQVLGLQWRPTPEMAKAAWRDGVRRTHPDHGGDPQAFAQVTMAYRIIVEALTHEEVCATCHGRKTITRASGFYHVAWPCPDCHGSGTAPTP